MREALLTGLAVTVVGFVAGWILRRRAPRAAHVFHFGAAALIRILAAVALVLGIRALLEHGDALHIAAAVALCVPAVWAVLSAVLMGYILLHREAHASSK